MDFSVQVDYATLELYDMENQVPEDVVLGRGSQTETSIQKLLMSVRQEDADKSAPINQLPHDILLRIMSHIPQENLYRWTRFTCKTFFIICRDVTLWRNVCVNQLFDRASRIPLILQVMSGLRYFQGVKRFHQGDILFNGVRIMLPLLPHLTAIELNQCPDQFSLQLILISIVKNCARAEELRLAYSSRGCSFDNECVRTVRKLKLKYLEVLYQGDYLPVLDVSFWLSITQYCPHLEALHLPDTKFDDELLRAISTSSHRLRQLSFACLKPMTPSGMTSISKMVELEWLSLTVPLSNCDAIFTTVAELTRALKRVNLKRLKNLKNLHLQSLFAKTPCLAQKGVVHTCIDGLNGPDIIFPSDIQVNVDVFDLVTYIEECLKRPRVKVEAAVKGHLKDEER